MLVLALFILIVNTMIFGVDNQSSKGFTSLVSITTQISRDLEKQKKDMTGYIISKFGKNSKSATAIMKELREAALNKKEDRNMK